MYFVFPLWVAAGFADWACHKRTHIAETAGLKESLLHVLMIVEAGAAILGALFLEINALILILLAGIFVVHQLTVYWDLTYAGRHRDISPFEQQVHSFQEMMPLVALILVVLAYWDQAVGALGPFGESADFSVRLREPALPADYLAVLFVCVVLFVIIPYGEEVWQGVRAARRPKENALQAPPPT
jgi:hypothetical protein